MRRGLAHREGGDGGREGTEGEQETYRLRKVDAIYRELLPLEGLEFDQHHGVRRCGVWGRGVRLVAGSSGRGGWGEEESGQGSATAAPAHYKTTADHGEWAVAGVRARAPVCCVVHRRKNAT